MKKLRYHHRAAEAQLKGDVIFDAWEDPVYLPPTHNDPAQGQYNRLIKKREQARTNDFIGLRTKNSKRFWYWQRAFHHTYRCDVCGSTEASAECRALAADNEPPDGIYCPEHARMNGFCFFCGELHAGEHSFDFQGDGLCHGCRLQLREDSTAGLFYGPYDIVVYRAPLKLFLRLCLLCDECGGAGTLELSQYTPTATETVLCSWCGGTGWTSAIKP